MLDRSTAFEGFFLMSGQIPPGRSTKTEGVHRPRGLLRFGPPLVSLTALLWAGHALAQTTVSSDTSNNLKTSSSGDITVNAGVNVKPASGVAVTIDSNNNVTNNGLIQFHNVDNTTGVQALGGVTTTITNSGSIVVDEDSAQTTDSNGIIHGPFAKGSNRFGLRLTGPSAITGSITNNAAGVISVVGNNSTALSIETNMIGSLINSGAITATGDGSIALNTTAGPITGNVTLAGTISASGRNAQAIALGDVGGAVNITASVTATGFRYTTRSTSPAFLNLLTADDLLVGGPAATIAGNVGGGVLLDATSTTDSSGVVTTTSGSLNSFGSAPALVVGAAGRNVTLGNVGTGTDAFGLELKGTVTSNGTYDGVSATGVQLGVANGGIVDTSGGVRVSGTVSATAFAASATGLQLQSGATVPVLKNEGNIAAVMSSDAAGGAATAINIQGGANAHTLQNSAAISAQVTGQQADAVAVRDQSGTITEVENIRTIAASRVLSTPGATVTGHDIALDFSANTSGVHIIQSDPSAGLTPPSIIGEVRTGSGDDRLEFLAGTVTGDVSLGAGANSLSIDGGTVVKGGLSANGGTLGLSVNSGTLQLTKPGQLSLTSLSLGAGSTLILTADPSSSSSTQLTVSGAAAIASGAKIGVGLSSLLDGSQTFTLIKAQSLTAGAIDSSLLGQVPFLYDSSLSTNAAAGTVTATLTRKTAAELGLPATTAAGYDAVVRAANLDPGLRSAMLAQTGRDGVINLYNALLPNHSGSIFDTAQATVEAFAQPLDDRQDPRGRGFWLQETNLGLVADDHDGDPGYRSYSFGLVGGYELPATALGILGVSVGLATTSIYPDHIEAAGEDLHANMMEAGLYWRASYGGFSANARLAGEYLKVSSTRAISILGADGLAVNAFSTANWNAYGVDGRAMISYEIARGHYYFRPLATVDYYRLMEDGYTEHGSGGMDLIVDSRTSSRMTAFAGVALGAVYGQTRDWGPEVTLGYKGVVSQDLGLTNARFASGGDPFTLRPLDISGAGAAAHIALRGENGSGAFAVEGGAETRDSLTIYDLKLAGHIQF
jgi:hypothetical protein